MGFVINKNGIRPEMIKIAVIEEFSEPKNVPEVGRFLCLIGYFRLFIPNFAHKCEPLTRLTQKDKTFEWKGEQKASFELLQVQLISEPILTHYQP